MKTSNTQTGLFLAVTLVACQSAVTDETDTATTTTTEVTIGNSAPEVSSVSLTPSTPNTNDVVSATVAVTDIDGDTVSVIFAWYVDGDLVAETSSSLDGALYFAKYQEIYVVVTPNDGFTDGLSVASSLTTVVNTPPDAPAIFIVPEDPDEADRLFCLLEGGNSFDLDNDSIDYSFDWTVDGVSFAGTAETLYNTGDTIPDSETSSGETWTCRVTPNDGDEDGASSVVSVIIEDSATRAIRAPVSPRPR